MTSISDSPIPTTPAADQPRVVILCATVWSVRNVAHSGLVDALRRDGLRVHLVVGASGSHPLLDMADTGDCSPLCDAPPNRSHRGKPTLEALLRASYCRRYRIPSYRIFNRWFRRAATPWQRVRNAAVELASVPGSTSLGMRMQVANLERFHRTRRDFSAVRAHLAALRPDLLVSTACIAGEEHPYLRVARDRGVRTLGCILSFDNLTSRTILPVFDDYAVWNERMREQVLALYPGRDPARVYITGTPQFDFHVNERFVESRPVTAKHLGIAPDDPYILYAANSAFFTPSEPRLVLDFARRLDHEHALARHRIVVRLHPLDEYSRWSDLAAAEPRIVISLPWDSAAGDFGPNDQRRLVSSLRHADVCLNTGSTMSLDAAALDVPVVCVAFARERGDEEDRLCRDLYDTEHYRHIVASRGVRLARKLDELVAETARYVNDPSRDRAERAALVRSEIGVVDGRATDRVAALIKSLAEAAS